jgi:hypothetical protein
MASPRTTPTAERKQQKRRAPQGDSVSASLLFQDATSLLEGDSPLRPKASSPLARTLHFEDVDGDSAGLSPPASGARNGDDTLDDSDNVAHDDGENEEEAMAAAFALQLEAEATAEYEAEEAELEKEQQRSSPPLSNGKGDFRRTFLTEALDDDEEAVVEEGEDDADDNDAAIETDGHEGGGFFMRPSTDWRSLQAKRSLFISRNSKVRHLRVRRTAYYF